MTHAFKEIRLTNSFINATGGVLKVGAETVVYQSQTGNLISNAQTGQFASVTNLNTTGQTLDSKINTLSGYSNTTFATAANLATTGAKIDALSGYSNSTFSTIANLNATGQTLNTKIDTLSGYSNTTFATVANVDTTGQTLFNRDAAISGVLDSRLDSTGQYLLGQIAANSAGVSSVASLTGAVLVTGFGNVVTSIVGNTIQISGNTGAYANFVQTGSQISLVTAIPTGIESYFVAFGNTFVSTPKVQATVEVVGDVMYAVNVRSRTVSGYTAIFSDTIYEEGVSVHTFASL